MKSCYVVVIIIALALQSCQHTQGINGQQNAAIYNTQLGLAYFKQGDRVLARHKLLLALAQAPDSPAVNASMAYFMEKTGDVNKADYYYRMALLRAHKQPGAHLNNYGAFLCRRGQYQQAEHYFRLAVEDVQYEHPAIAYENAGLCALAINNEHKAIGYFKQALLQDPSRYRSLSEIRRIELKHGKNWSKIT